MEWVKLYTDLPDHHKLVDAGGEAGWHEHLALYTAALCYSGKHETAGLVPKPIARVVTTLADPASVVADLVRAGLWEERGESFYIVGWDKKQPDVEDLRRKRSEAGRKGGQARAKQKQTPGNPQANAKASVSSTSTSNSPTATTEDEELGARLRVLPTVRQILNGMVSERQPLTELDDVRILSAIESVPAVDPVEAARAAVARGKQNIDRVDMLLRELRGLQTRAERNAPKEEPAKVQNAGQRPRGVCSECGEAPADVQGRCSECHLALVDPDTDDEDGPEVSTMPTLAGALKRVDEAA